MRFPLAHLVLLPPDESVPYWYLSHDFAEVLGLEFSRDAAKAFRKLLAPHKVQVDYEADQVSLRIARKENVIPALRALYAHVGWDAAELDELEPTVRAFQRPRPRAVAAGDVFLVPLGDGSFGLGQVLALQRKAPTVALFRSKGLQAELASLDPAALRPLSILHLGVGCSLYSGAWPIIGSAPVRHDPSSGPGGKHLAVGCISFGGDGPTLPLLRSAAGLEAQVTYADPNYLTRFMMK